jgi:hypothetical protein
VIAMTHRTILSQRGMCSQPWPQLPVKWGSGGDDFVVHWGPLAGRIRVRPNGRLVTEGCAIRMRTIRHAKLTLRIFRKGKLAHNASQLYCQEKRDEENGPFPNVSPPRRIRK